MKKQIWMSGGGTQSNAIAILIIQGKLPRPDLCIIADTEHETETTWQYLDHVTNPALAKIGLEVVRVKATLWASQGLRINYPKTSTGGGKLMIPAYSTEYGSTNKLSNFCTTEWKVEPIERYLSKVHGITRSKYQKWIGFTRDEQRRWARMMQGKEYLKGLIRLPLVHDFPMTRQEAIRLVEEFGWPSPPRSACWMCPNKSDREWILEKNERPDEFKKAVDFEKKMQGTNPDSWLHKSAVPLDDIKFAKPEEDLFSRPCDSGICFV